MHSHLDLATKAWKSIRECIRPYSEPLSARSMPHLGKHTTATWEIPTMSAAPGPARNARQPDPARHQSSQSGATSDASLEIEELEDESGSDDAPPQNPGPEAADSDRSARPKSPAYVAPIADIPPASPVSPPAGIEAPRDRLQLPEYIGRFLVNKQVTETGEIIDGESHQVLAHAGGDLPALVGLRVSNARGDILDSRGVLVGWVEELELGRPRGSPGAAHAPKSLFELLGQRTAAPLMLDQHQNLLDSAGRVVGTYFDNNNPQHRKEKEEREANAAQARSRQDAGRPAQDTAAPEPAAAPRGRDPEAEGGESGSRARRSESERRRNAESWRKENPGESPSDIFLDVKSTTTGIQICLRIPTVFGGQQLKPNISFS